MVKEFSIYLENNPGILAQMIKSFDANGIIIEAISVVESKDYGLVMILVNKPEECEEMLVENEIEYSIADVVAVSLANKRSLLFDIAELMGINNINIEYMYSTLVMDEAHLIIRTNDNHKAINILKGKAFSILESL